MPSRFFIVACESSGDAHGAHLMEEIKRLNPGAEFRGLGGPKMAAAGLDLLYDMTRISALGLGDVLRQYFKYRKIFYQAVHAIREWKPDAVIVIDSPAFNLRLAKKISKLAPVIYYISPQLWAWGARRIKVIQKHIAHMLVILPFETGLYQKAHVPVTFVGHPLLDEISPSQNREALRARLGLKQGEIGIGLLPGSRRKEVQRIFPVMLEAAEILRRKVPQAVFYFRPAPSIPYSVYASLLEAHPGLAVRHPDLGFHDLVHSLDFALVTSGTATLETALMGTPYFLLYKASTSTYWLGRWLIRVRYLGLVNLLAGKSVVPEFIQTGMQPETIAHEAEIFLKNPDLARNMREEFENVRMLLGSSGASRRAAEAVLKFVTHPSPEPDRKIPLSS